MKFYRDVPGFPLKFESPEWSEFAIDETTLAWHPASQRNPAGTAELGFTVSDIHKFRDQMPGKGLQFSMPPSKQDYEGLWAQFGVSEGGHCSVASPLLAPA